MCQGICVLHGDGQNLVHNPNKCVSEKYPLNYDQGSATEAVSGSKRHLLPCSAMAGVQRIPPGMQPLSRIAEFTPGAKEARRQKILKLTHENSEAPPPPPAPSQSTQVPAKGTSFLTRKNGDFGVHPFRPGLGGCRGGEVGGPNGLATGIIISSYYYVVIALHSYIIILS